MKNNILLFSIILLSPLLGYAQEFSNFGLVSKEETALKECPFDKEANAVVLLNEADANYDDEYHLIYNRHIRIKILKEKGFDQADITIPFYRKDNFERIDKLEAMITNVNADGTATSERLDKKSFYKKNEDEFFGKMIFTFPNVKVGSILEYKYQSFMEHYGGLDDWHFHGYLPVVKSAFTLHIPPRLEFAYSVIKLPDMPIIVKQDKDNATVYFEMDNIAGLDDEPFMDARKDYIQKVNFQLSGRNFNNSGKQNFMTTWDEVIREYTTKNEFGHQLGKNLAGTGNFIDEVKKIATDDEKVKVIYNYVRTTMSWNGINSRSALDGIKDAWNKKKGTNGEINLILINLLKDAGLDAYPMLVSERYHGKVNTQYPFVDQFNTVYAYVIVNEKKYYLDAADIYTPAHMIPGDILNTTALIVNRKHGGLVNITNDSLKYSDYTAMLMEVDNNGKLSGEVYVKSSDYSRVKKLNNYKEAGKEKYMDSYFNKDGITVSNFEFLNETNDSLPIEQKFKFSTSLSASGDYLFIPLNLFLGFDKNPFVANNRFSNVNFGYKRMINAYTSVSLPKNYTLDGLPKPVKMTTPDNDIVFSRNTEYDKENNTVTCTFLFDFRKSLYTVDEYPVLQEVYKKIFEFLKEPLVLKKK
jgi:hypothetical protein